MAVHSGLKLVELLVDFGSPGVVGLQSRFARRVFWSFCARFRGRSLVVDKGHGWVRGGERRGGRLLVVRLLAVMMISSRLRPNLSPAGFGENQKIRTPPRGPNCWEQIQYETLCTRTTQSWLSRKSQICKTRRRPSPTRYACKKTEHRNNLVDHLLIRPPTHSAV